MDFSFTREQELLRKSVRDFAEAEIAPKALELDKKGEFESDLVAKMGQMGLIGLASSKEFGGSGMGHVARMIAMEELSRVYPSLGFFLQTGNLLMYAIDAFGTPEQKKKYLPDLNKGVKTGAFAVTEPSGGSDPSTITTTAKLDGNGYIINGRKTYISHADCADITGFLAKTDAGLTIFLVEKGTPGYEITRREARLGLRSVPVNEFVLTNCRLPKENILGAEGKGIGLAITSISVMGRTGAAGVALGAAEGAYEAALKFCKERVLYGKPITNLQSIQFMLVDMNTEIEAAKWLYYRPGCLLDQGKNPREVSVDIARSKLYCIDMAVKNCTKAVQLMGAYGLSPEYHVERFLRDVLELFPAAGTQEVMRLTIGGAITR
ncbi:MAG: acyl-CoA dehydrogenase family protein [Dehalococcoidales bacterium]|nr:acyl-CoA dehydrogenase family protein [Dehalococcoidales bacterium]